jgi:hypothetical protein
LPMRVPPGQGSSAAPADAQPKAWVCGIGSGPAGKAVETAEMEGGWGKRQKFRKQKAEMCGLVNAKCVTVNRRFHREKRQRNNSELFARAGGQMRQWHCRNGLRQVFLGSGDPWWGLMREGTGVVCSRWRARGGGRGRPPLRPGRARSPSGIWPGRWHYAWACSPVAKQRVF